MEENPNYIVREWKVTLYSDDFFERRKILIIIGTFIDVFMKVKHVMDSAYYTSMYIEEVKQ